MISAQDDQTVAEMLSIFRNPQVIVTHQNCYVKTLQKQFSLQRKTICHQTAYLKKVPLPVPKTGAVIRPLDETCLPFVLKHYTHAEDNEPYVLGRLKSGAMFGAYIENRLAGFIGTHAEGAMGMLEVLPEFRRQGVAAVLETFLVNRFLSEGRIPFAQIIAGNEASLKLHEKLNFSVTDLTLCWLS
ncbi:GNAT family N-acetyltransferase [Caproiciproducens faecalis]|uniref:GNAT family N-acetyltransferase n=1 Tax=Caproiciproducens faecalis TaxID=2820301 RepID=A0ABS7DQS7_9FIRM|nr:GNAT family N-acetyltransferase [Caproiciproducens faecalis]MBW7573664.1 GNAT family N-acetyltransferase [Caproiciproducens faecalis]